MASTKTPKIDWLTVREAAAYVSKPDAPISHTTLRSAIKSHKAFQPQLATPVRLDDDPEADETNKQSKLLQPNHKVFTQLIRGTDYGVVQVRKDALDDWLKARAEAPEPTRGGSRRERKWYKIRLTAEQLTAFTAGKLDTTAIEIKSASVARKPKDAPAPAPTETAPTETEQAPLFNVDLIEA